MMIGVWILLYEDRGVGDVKKKKGWNPNPFVVLPGFEPGQTEPKPVVLPLHHKTILSSKRCSSQKRCKVTTNFWNHQIFLIKKSIFL